MLRKFKKGDGSDGEETAFLSKASPEKPSNYKGWKGKATEETLIYIKINKNIKKHSKALYVFLRIYICLEKRRLFRRLEGLSPVVVRVSEATLCKIKASPGVSFPSPSVASWKKGGAYDH